MDGVVGKMAIKQKASSEGGLLREGVGRDSVTNHHPTAIQVETLKGEGRPMDVRPPEEKWAPETAKLSSPVQGLTPNRTSSSLGKMYCPEAG